MFASGCILGCKIKRGLCSGCSFAPSRGRYRFIVHPLAPSFPVAVYFCTLYQNLSTMPVCLPSERHFFAGGIRRAGGEWRSGGAPFTTGPDRVRRRDRIPPAPPVLWTASPSNRQRNVRSVMEINIVTRPCAGFQPGQGRFFGKTRLRLQNPAHPVTECSTLAQFIRNLLFLYIIHEPLDNYG